MPQPFHIIAGPVSAWIAPTGTVFPVLGVAPAATWIALGTNQDKDVTEDGLTIRQGQEVEEFFGLGTTARRKTFRTRESLEVEFQLADLTIEAYAKGMGAAATTAGGVTTVAGPPATKTTPLLRGTNIDTVALLLRLGVSGYGDTTATLVTQWKIPMVQQAGAAELVFTKGVPAAWQYLYKAVWDPSLGFGTVEMGTA